MTVHKAPVRVDLITPKRKITKSHNAVRGIRNTVVQEVKDWIQECVKNHWFLFEQNGNLWIAFHCERDAMFYKLAWH